jgi:hypothetical protein
MRWIRLLSAAGLVAATLLTPVAVAAPADHDPTFGTAGVVMTDVRTTGSSDYVNDLVLQPDGKLVAVGRSSNTGGVDGCPVFALTLENCGNANNNWSLARYNPDGSLDSSFAISGRGTVTLDTFNFGNGELSAVAMRPDGTLVAVGERASLLSEPARDNLHGAIVLFAANGAPLAHVALPARLVFGGLIRKTIGAADSSDYVLVRYLGDLGTPPTAPDVALTIVDSSDPVAPRDLLTYTLRIVNEGSATATDVGLSADLPKLGFDSVSTSQGSCRRRGLKLTCELGSIAPSATATLTIAGSAKGKPEVLELSASVATVGDADPADNSAVEQTTVQ